MRKTLAEQYPSLQTFLIKQGCHALGEMIHHFTLQADMCEALGMSRTGGMISNWVAESNPPSGNVERRARAWLNELRPRNLFDAAQASEAMAAKPDPRPAPPVATAPEAPESVAIWMVMGPKAKVDMLVRVAAKLGVVIEADEA